MQYRNRTRHTKGDNMLPVEFKKDDYRFSFVGMDGENLTYSGARLVNGEHISIGRLTVKPTTTKPVLHRLFMALEAMSSRATAPEPNPVKRAMRRYSGPELARKLGVTHQAAYRYASGQRPIPGPVRALLQVIMAGAEEK